MAHLIGSFFRFFFCLVIALGCAVVIGFAGIAPLAAVFLLWFLLKVVVR